MGKRVNGRVPRPREEWIFVGHVPAIVSPEQFDQVQAKLARNKQMAKRNNKAHTYLLRALVSCGLCHYTCRGQTRRRYAYYQCVGKGHAVSKGYYGTCPSRLIPMKQLDQIVWDDLCDVVMHPEMIALALERAQAGQWLPQELQARCRNLQRASHQLTQQIERLTEAYLAGILGLEEYRRRRQEIEKHIAVLTAQRQELQMQAGRQVEISGWVIAIDAFCQRVRTSLDTATFEQKRQLVELLIDRVVVTNDEVEIRYVIPLDPKTEHIRFYQLCQDYFERLNKTYEYECLRIYHPETLAATHTVNAHFKHRYNFQRPNQAITCHNQPPRVAFPDLPTLEPLPAYLDPDAWLLPIDGRCFKRRVNYNGSVQIDKHDYYIRQELQGHYVILQVDAKARQFVVKSNQIVFKQLPIKGLHHGILPLADYIERICQEAISEWRQSLAQAKRPPSSHDVRD